MLASVSDEPVQSLVEDSKPSDWKFLSRDDAQDLNDDAAYVVAA